MMAEFSTKQRKALKPAQFGMPGSNNYPMPDRSHTAIAAANKILV